MISNSSLGPLEKQIMNAVWNEKCETGKQVWEKIGSTFLLNEKEYCTYIFETIWLKQRQQEQLLRQIN